MGLDTNADILTLRRPGSSQGGLGRKDAQTDMECLLRPRQGGSIARLTRHGPDGAVPLLRPASDWALRNGSAIDMGCFPLVPFSNRIADGRFGFDGRTVELPLNMDGCPHAIHGDGWQAPWTVEERSGAAARLVHRHGGTGWPWRYRAIQDIALEEDGLSVTLTIINEDERPMPAGIGLHPYFPKPPGTRLSAKVGGVWMNGPTLLPQARTALPAAWDFPDGVVMDRTVLDNGFTGWDGRAALDWPDRGLRLSLTTDGPFGHLVVYAPQGDDYLCVEPVSHMTDAVNHGREADAGLRALNPGDSLHGTMRLRLEPLHG